MHGLQWSSTDVSPKKHKPSPIPNSKEASLLKLPNIFPVSRHDNRHRNTPMQFPTKPQNVNV